MSILKSNKPILKNSEPILRNCSACKKQISNTASSCPNCGHKATIRLSYRLAAIIYVLFNAYMVLNWITGGTSSFHWAAGCIILGMPLLAFK